MLEYIKYPNKECSRSISTAMNKFLKETYFNDGAGYNPKKMDIGIMMRRYLSFIPLIHLLLNGNSEMCNKLEAKGSNLKLIQYIQIIASMLGISSLMKILSEQEGNRSVINFDLSFIFNKKIWSGMEKRLIKRSNSNTFIVKNKKINKKKQEYFNIKQIYDHIFHDLLTNLTKLTQNSSFNCDTITIYINCSSM